MKARYFIKDDYWVLVDVLEISENLCKILPTEWIGIERREIVVPRERLEIIFQGGV